MLEPLFNAVLKVASRPAYVGEFSTAAQCIDHQVGITQPVLHGIIELVHKVLPLSLLRSNLLLSLEVTYSHVVGLDHKLAPCQIKSLSLKIIHYNDRLFFLHGVPLLGVTKLLTLKSNGMIFLH